jgi:single-strand DNA-binding protein
MLNHIDIMGRFTKSPELRFTKSGIAVTSFTLAVDRDYSGNDGEDKQTDFIDFVAWKKTAEFVTTYFSKGRMAVVSGRLQVRPWEDDNGHKNKAVEVVAENVYFGDSKKDTDNGEAPPQRSNTAPVQQAPGNGITYQELGEDEELPF